MDLLRSRRVIVRGRDPVAFPRELVPRWHVGIRESRDNRVVLVVLTPWRRQRRDPAQHAPKQSPREMTLLQQQPIIAGVLDQASARFHQPLLQACQRPGVN